MRVGLLGAGNISGIMAHTIRGMEGVVCVAVASRDITKAEEFAKKYNIQKAYGSYQEMLKDDEVDLVYVADRKSVV